MLKQISINGFRGFGEKEIVNFSLPDGEKEGSGLTTLVGPNNSGKTTIIEAIKYYNKQESNISFSEGKRNIRNKSIVDIIYTDEKEETIEIHTVESGGSKVIIKGKNDENKNPYVLQSRRYVDYTSSSNFYIQDRKSYLLNLAHNNNSNNNRSFGLSMFEQRIFQWQKNKSAFDKLLKTIIKDEFEWTIEENDFGSYYVKMIFADGTISHTREGMGDGYWSIFTIVDAIYDSKPESVIVIDEPELSLHPSFQKRLLHLLEEYSKDRQIIISTHSPYFISLKSITNGGSLIRTYKDNNSNIKTGQIEDEDRIFIKNILSNINNPHILGLEARELFFIEDNIIITEGQEDVVMIPRMCNDLGISINASLFGWGAGGAENITKVINMLKNLGYKKVTAIYDGDKEEEYKMCKKKFEKYNILLLFEDDIRDKKAENKKEKKGVATDKGVIKEENKEKFKELINSINDYHSTLK